MKNLCAGCTFCSGYREEINTEVANTHHEESKIIKEDIRPRPWWVHGRPASTLWRVYEKKKLSRERLTKEKYCITISRYELKILTGNTKDVE